MRISIRICDATLVLSCIEMPTCDPNSIDLIIEDKFHDYVPHQRNLYTRCHCKAPSFNIFAANIQARDLFEEVDTPSGKLTIPAIAPKLSRTPGKTDFPGGAVGVDTDSVLTEVGYGAAELAELRKSGDI